ncbi:hypothetical protein HPB47_016814, partial [Ixodes persulcatus]
FPTMFVSVISSCIPDFHQKVDLLPPSVRIVILHVTTNDLAFHDPQPVLQHYLDLLHNIRTRPGIQLIVCCHIVPWIINRHLHSSNRHFTDAFNHRARIFNRQLTDLCMSTPDPFFHMHNLQACRLPRALAADGLHPSFAKALIPCLLRQILRPRGALALDSHWLTLGEDARMQHRGPTRPTTPQPATPPQPRHTRRHRE